MNEQVRVELANGADVNAIDDDGDTALYYALSNQHLTTVDILLAHGANPTIGGASGSPVRVAAAQGWIEILHRLVDAGADVNGTESVGTVAGVSPLMMASGNGSDKAVSLLVQLGADLDRPDSDGDTAIGYAASRGQISTVRLLIAMGADPDPQPGSSGHTPLTIAAAMATPVLAGSPGTSTSDYSAIVLALLWAGADAALMYENGFELVRPVDGRIEIALLEHVPAYLVGTGWMVAYRPRTATGSATDEHTKGDASAELSLIVRQYSPIDAAQAAQRAFESRSLINEALARMGQWGLHAEAGRLGLAEWVSQGAPLNGVARIEYGDDLVHWETPLLTAFIDGRRAAVAGLLELGADVDAPNAIKLANGTVLNHTALHMLAQRGDNEGAALLIMAGADVNRRTSLGTTSLHFAAGKDNVDLVALLLRAGANPLLREFDTDNPGEWGDLPVDQAGPRTRLLLRRTPSSE